MPESCKEMNASWKGALYRRHHRLEMSRWKNMRFVTCRCDYGLMSWQDVNAESGLEMRDINGYDEMCGAQYWD